MPGRIDHMAAEQNGGTCFLHGRPLHRGGVSAASGALNKKVRKPSNRNRFREAAVTLAERGEDRPTFSESFAGNDYSRTAVKRHRKMPRRKWISSFGIGLCALLKEPRKPTATRPTGYCRITAIYSKLNWSCKDFFVPDDSEWKLPNSSDKGFV